MTNIELLAIKKHDSKGFFTLEIFILKLNLESLIRNKISNENSPLQNKSLSKFYFAI